MASRLARKSLGKSFSPGNCLGLMGKARTPATDPVALRTEAMHRLDPETLTPTLKDLPPRRKLMGLAQKGVADFGDAAAGAAGGVSVEEGLADAVGGAV
jgi:hypothetical protein